MRFCLFRKRRDADTRIKQTVETNQVDLICFDCFLADGDGLVRICLDGIEVDESFAQLVEFAINDPQRIDSIKKAFFLYDEILFYLVVKFKFLDNRSLILADHKK